jgi:hypothetical protein
MLEIRKVIDNTAQITAMISARIFSIIGRRGSVRRSVVCLVAVGKTVGHDQVDDVINIDALKMCSGGEWRLQ